MLSENYQPVSIEWKTAKSAADTVVLQKIDEDRPVALTSQQNDKLHMSTPDFHDKVNSCTNMAKASRLEPNQASRTSCHARVCAKSLVQIKNSLPMYNKELWKKERGTVNHIFCFNHKNITFKCTKIKTIFTP